MFAQMIHRLTPAARRLTAGALAACMLLTLLPASALAEEGDGLCEHHPTHTSACGYAAAVAQTPCGYVCDDCAAPQPELEPEPSAYEAALALFAALPDPADVADMTDEEKEALSAQIGAATDALFALPDEDYARFMDEHTAYMERVSALQDAMTGGVMLLAATMPTLTYNVLCANGTPLLITADGVGTTIYIDSNGNGVRDNGEQSLEDAGMEKAPVNGVDLSSWHILGGSESSDVAVNTKITMTGGEVDNIYGGGRKENAKTGNTTVNVTGGTVRNIYGGGDEAKTTTGATSVTISGSASVTNVYGGGSGEVNGNTTVNITGGTVENVYGGGSSYGKVNGNTKVSITGGTVVKVYGGEAFGSVTNDTEVSITGGKVEKDVYGGGYGGTVGSNTKVSITGGTVGGNVYGGGYSDTVTGNTMVSITDGTVTQNVYGGGNNREVGGSTDVRITGGTVGKNVYGGGYYGTVSSNTKVSITGGTVEESVYGGGRTGTVTGNKSVTVGGNAKIGNFNAFDGIVINVENVANGVDTFAIEPNLTGEARVHVRLPSRIAGNTTVATGAVAGDVAYIKPCLSIQEAFFVAGDTILIHKHSWSNDWSSDDSHHWHNCTAEGCLTTDNSKKNSYDAHDYGSSTCTEPPKCTCGKTNGAAPGHDLSYSANGDTITESCSRGDHSATATISATGKPYDGAAVTASINCDSGWIGDKPTEITYPTGNTTAGTHTASFTVDSATASVSFTISKAEVTPPTIASKVYNGTNQKAAVSDTDRYKVETNSGGVDAGKYDVVLTLKDSANYKWKDSDSNPLTLQFEITNAGNEWSAQPSISGWTYGSTPNNPAGAAQFGTVTVEYKLQDAAESTYTTTQPTNAGAYTARFSVAGTTSYTALSKTVDFTIAQKEVGLTWSGHQNPVYTGNAVNVTAAATNLVGSDTCTVTVTGGTKKDAGTHTATATGLSNSNYKLPEAKTQQYTIAEAPVSFVVTNNEHDYDATAKAATVTQTENQTPSVAGHFSVSYKQGEETVDPPQVVGNYEIWVTLTSDNFKFSGETDVTRSKQVGTLTINGSAYPEQDKITWPTAASLTYGAALSQSALTGGGTTSKGGAGSFAWKEQATIPTVANGGYTVVFTPDDRNYSTVEKTVSITVNPKELTITGATATNRDYAPGNTAVTVSGGRLEGVVTRSDAPDNVTLDDSNAAGTVLSPNAGTDKTVTVTGYEISGTDAGNYTLKQPEDVTVTIAKAVGSGSVTMAGWRYGNAAQSPVPVSDTNGVESVTYQYTGTKQDKSSYNSTTAPTDAGKYTVTATFAETDNYQAVTATSDVFTIAPKLITAQWKQITQVYDDTPKSPTLTLVDVETADQDSVSADLLAGDNKTDAGSYPVSAGLTGTRAFNYTLTNPSGTLVIQKAPVTFTVTNNTVAYAGEVKTATVSAEPDASHTVTYKNRAGEIVESPTDVGSYDIWAKLTDENYRHADSTGGEERKIGTLTIYQNTPPATYTVSFASGEGDEGGGSTDALPAALPGTLRVLPDCGFSRDGWAFTGWKRNGQRYQPGATLEQPAQNLTFTAEWAEVVHEINGVVKQGETEVQNAVVTLMRGSRHVAETTTGEGGKFKFINVTPGLYNLVGSNDGVVMTVKVLVETTDVETKIMLPKGKTNSVVEVLAGTPEVVVGNLEAAFDKVDAAVYTEEDKKVVENGGTVEIKLTAQAVAAGAEDKGQTTIEQKAQNVGLYLELSLKKTVTETSSDPVISNLFTSGDVLLESIVPLPAGLQGKYRYAVHRLHDPDGESSDPPRLDTLTETPNEAGEYIEVSEDKTTVTIHAKDYSLYAIAWEERRSSGAAAADPPVVTETEHGRVEVSPKRPAKGDTVTITPLPDEGYAVGTVTVTDKSGKELPVTDNGDGTYAYTQPSGSVTITVTFVPQQRRWNPFADVKSGDWYHDSVKYVYERGLMNGTGETAFSPGLSTTRGMIVTMLWRLEQEPESGADMAFADVTAGSYYGEAVRWAAVHEIVKGYTATTFGPDNTITRQELAAMLYRYAQYKGADVGAGENTNILSYADVDQAGAWAIPALQWACGAGVLQGKGGGLLDPRGDATRAEAAAMLQRFVSATAAK